MSKPRVSFFHSPQSRSAGTRALLEELAADYELHVLSLKAGEQRQPAYLAINPMAKNSVSMTAAHGLIQTRIDVIQWSKDSAKLCDCMKTRRITPATAPATRVTFHRAARTPTDRAAKAHE